MSALSPKQVQALRWIDAQGSLPASEPSTWKSLIRRGLIELPMGAAPRLTGAGREVLS